MSGGVVPLRSFSPCRSLGVTLRSLVLSFEVNKKVEKEDHMSNTICALGLFQSLQVPRSLPLNDPSRYDCAFASRRCGVRGVQDQGASRPQ